MPGVSASSQSSNPYLDFKFRLKSNGKYVAAASKCSPLKRANAIAIQTLVLQNEGWKRASSVTMPPQQGEPRGGPDR